MTHSEMKSCPQGRARACGTGPCPAHRIRRTPPAGGIRATHVLVSVQDVPTLCSAPVRVAPAHLSSHTAEPCLATAEETAVPGGASWVGTGSWPALFMFSYKAIPTAGPARGPLGIGCGFHVLHKHAYFNTTLSIRTCDYLFNFSCSVPLKGIRKKGRLGNCEKSFSERKNQSIKQESESTIARLKPKQNCVHTSL